MTNPSLSLRRSPRHSIPTLRKSWIDRPHLMDRLHGNIGAGLAVIQAPAGYGKTTLLAQFATDSISVGFKPCWLSLDSTSVVPAAFALQIAEAFDEDEALQNLTGGTAPADLKAFVARAVAGMRERSHRPVLLVLDNTQEIANSPDAVDLLTWLIASLPEGYEVILAGREALALEESEAGLAAGDFLWLGTRDLAFERSEIGLLPPARASVAIDADQVMAATDGWPIGVLALHHGTVSLDSTFPVRAAGSWDRFLVSQIWSSVPDALKPAITTLCVTPQIDDALAVSLIGHEPWADVRTWFEQHAWLAENLEDGSHRLNPLLRGFLLRTAAREDEERVQASAETVAGRLEESGRFVDALEAALATDHQHLLASLLEQHCGEELLRGSFALLRRAFAGLSVDLIAGRPLLRAYQARVKAETGEAPEALEEVATLLAERPRGGRVTMNSYLAKVRALRFTDKIDEMGAVFDQIRAVTDVNDAALVAELLFHQAGYEIAVHSNFLAAEELLHRVVDSCVDIGARELELLARSTLGQVHAMRGEAPLAVEELTKAAKGWRSLGGCANVGWVLNNLGMAHLTGGDFKSAVSVLTDAIAEAAATGNARSEAYATASLADAEIARGNWEKAQEHYQEALRICSQKAPDASLAILTVVGLSAASLGLGDVEQADFYIARAALIAAEKHIPFEHGSVMQQHSAVLARAGDQQAATMFAHEAKLAFGQIDSLPSLRLATYRYAMCLFNEGNRVAAATELIELGENTPEPWMMGALQPLVAEAPLFAQWAAGRPGLSPILRQFLARESMRPEFAENARSVQVTSTVRSIHASSLGPTSVTVDGKLIPNRAWESARAKEMFFLLLHNREGIRKEEAVDQLSPGLSAAKQNSTFHSNLFRVRKALYGIDSVKEDDGIYALDPTAEVHWDVREFEERMDAARALPQGSKERADSHQHALEVYRGPFAKEFFNDWAAAVRLKIEQQKVTALAGLAGFFAANAKYELAIECLERVMQGDQLNEEAAFQLVTMKAQAGQTVSALSLCDEFSERFEVQLGAPPPARFSMLRSRIAAGTAV